jgi:hypothetical protein
MENIVLLPQPWVMLSILFAIFLWLVFVKHVAIFREVKYKGSVH